MWRYEQGRRKSLPHERAVGSGRDGKRLETGCVTVEACFGRERQVDGGTYNVTAELTAPNTISARVYRGVPLFGRTEILIRDPPLSFDGRC